jgi:hypothetical protein
LLCDFFANVRQARISLASLALAICADRRSSGERYVGIRRVAAQDNPADPEPLAGAKNRPHVVRRANIVRDHDNFSHIFYCNTRQNRKLFAILALVNEEEVQRRRREQDERATQRRAAILGLPSLDTRLSKQKIQSISQTTERPKNSRCYSAKRSTAYRRSCCAKSTTLSKSQCADKKNRSTCRWQRESRCTN